MSITSRPATPAITLFEVAFTSAMTEHDLGMLACALALTTTVGPAGRPRADDLGFARMDSSSGLFLTRGTEEGRWVIRGRTWGHPAAGSVHEWHVLAAGAAHQLDPAVTAPTRLKIAPSTIPDRSVERLAGTRLTRFRRRLVGVG
ncbi:MAG: hypothetical protein ACLPZR_27725 [Solirubrobacteraceae bacterium]